MSENEKLLEQLKKVLHENHIPEILTQEQLSKYYGFSKSWQTKWRAKDKPNPIPHIKVGGEIRYKRKEFESWLELHKVA